jgi:dephospho-CoA kinase
MKLPKIIGLLGRSGRGKDTVATYIIEKHPHYINVKFAKIIKEIAGILFDWNSEVETVQKNIVDSRWGISPREAMVFITNVFREKMGADFFSKRIFQKHQDDYIIITDLRYEPDIEEIKKRGGIIIKILRNTEPNYEWEDDIDGFYADYTICNNGSREYLLQQINQIL